MDSHFPHHKWFSSVFTDTTTFYTHRQLETLHSACFLLNLWQSPFLLPCSLTQPYPWFFRGSCALITLISWSSSLSGICQYCHLIWGTSTMFLSLWHSCLLFLSPLCHEQAQCFSLMLICHCSPPLFFPHHGNVCLDLICKYPAGALLSVGKMSPDRTLNKTSSEF